MIRVFSGLDDPDLYFNTSLFFPPLLRLLSPLLFQSPVTVFMDIPEAFFVETCVEGFLYG